MARTDPQVNIRMSEELRDTLAAIAKQNNRSMNAEIIARLEGSIDIEMMEAGADLMANEWLDQFAAKVEEILDRRDRAADALRPPGVTIKKVVRSSGKLKRKTEGE